MHSNMPTIAVNQLKSISSLPRDYVNLSQQAEETGEVVFLKHNSPYVVLVGFERWQQLKEKEEQLDAQRAVATVAQSEKEYRLGKAKRLQSFAKL